MLYFTLIDSFIEFESLSGNNVNSKIFALGEMPIKIVFYWRLTADNVKGFFYMNIQSDLTPPDSLKLSGFQ